MGNRRDRKPNHRGDDIGEMTRALRPAAFQPGGVSAPAFADTAVLVNEFGEVGLDIRHRCAVALWVLGYPTAALAADQALRDALRISQSATLMLTLTLVIRS